MITVKGKRVVVIGLMSMLLGGLFAVYLGDYVYQVDYAKIPSDRSEYLKGIVEPIRMASAIGWDDGSIGAVFKDAAGKERAICLQSVNLGERGPLRFGSASPENGAPVPMCGSDEQAFLGLLERWYQGSRDAQAWMAKINQANRLQTGRSVLHGDESSEQSANAIVVSSVLKALRARNPTRWFTNVFGDE